MTEYIVQKGDTLSAIAKRFSNSGENYLKLAGVNNITDPNKIVVGQKLYIPEKFDKPLKKSEIPTNNKIQVIDNFSPNYNYIVEGDKVYYSRKGRDYWVDISENDKARKNLLKFLHDKYQFKGYEDGESDIYDKILNEGWTYKTRKDFEQPEILNYFLNFGKQSEPVKYDWNEFNLRFIKNQPSYTPKKNSDINTESLNWKDLWYEYNPESLYQKVINWTTRQFDKISTKEEAIPISFSPDEQYSIRRDLSFTGDTIPVTRNPRRYIVPENINLKDYTFGVRNRGDLNEIQSEAAVLTAFSPFIDYEKLNRQSKEYKKYNTFIGIDQNNKIKIGPYDKFGPGDILTGTFANNIRGLKHDENGNIQYKVDPRNAPRKVPITLVVNDDGTEGFGSLNILTNLPSAGNENLGNTYGNISGGRVIIEAGNQLRLVSGTIEYIDKEIEALKKQENVDQVTVYTLDNGSYNRGLRTYDGVFTSKDLKNYDKQNNGGGNFLYVKSEIPREFSFKSDTVLTPNIRTKNSESYLNGHPLKNELQGIVLHHTGFRDKDLAKAINHMTDPKTEASAHVLIGYDGNRVVLADPEKVTFHAGYSRFNNRANVNDFMLGIEFQGDTSREDLTDAQIRSAVEYIAPIIQKYKIPLANIVTHKQVRDLYNEYQRQNNQPQAPSKKDLNAKNYNRIIEELIKTVYYSKQGGKLNYLNYFNNE